MTDFKRVSLTPEATDALQAAKIRLTSPAGRSVSLSDALLAALAVAADHEDEWLVKLTRQD